MSIVKENLEQQLELIKVTITPEEYNPIVEKQLKGYAKKANIPGFRVGHVPMSIIKKMYYKGALAEESYRMASEQVFKYIKDNNIEIIAEPMPSGTQPDLDFENPTSLEFHFKVAVAPEINIDIKNTPLEKVSITADDDMKKDYRENYMRRYAQMKNVDEVTKDEAVMADFEQDGTTIEDVYVGLVSMAEADAKPFIGKKVGDVMKVNINKLFPDEERRAGALKMKVEEVKALKANFNITIKEIKGLGFPELNEEFFKMAFPNGDVKNEADFDKMIDENLSKELEREAKFYFMTTTREKLIELAGITLPEAFLKEWILAVNQEKFTEEQVEKDFPQYLEIVRWGLIQKKFVKEADLKVTKEEIIDEAKATARTQFAQYGLPNVEDNMVERFAQQMLSNETELRKINEALYETKVMDWFEANAKIKTKKVTVDQFKKLVEKQ
ncbi:MAG: trigger factor [Rikenellaceae bacterium]